MDFSGERIMQAGAGALVVGIILIGVGWLTHEFGG